MKISKLLMLLFILGFCTLAKGNINPNKYFQDNMLIQQDMPIIIWGTGSAGEKVNISLCNVHKNTAVNDMGIWEVVLPAIGASNNSCILKVNEKVFNNVLIGELWIAAGQSNMVKPLRNSDTYQDFVALNDPKFRLLRHKMQVPLTGVYQEKHYAKSNEKSFFKSKWEQSLTDNKGIFSAVGWHFGHQLRKELDIPIGVIQLAVGGSSMTEWIRLKTLQQEPFTSQMTKDWPEGEMVSTGVYKRFKKSFNSMLKNDEYNKYSGPTRHMTEPSFLFDAGVKALGKIAFRGVIWYQGEANSHRPQDFKHLFPMLVKDWREFFGHKEFPFYYVQLPSFRTKTWPQVRQIQQDMLKDIPNSGMVVTLDLGLENDIHPTDKKPIGERLAKMALSKNYGKKTLWQSPFPVSHSFSKNGLLLTFDYIGEGLMSSTKQIKGFEVSNENGEFKPYNAVIVAPNKIQLTGAPSSAKAIRYAYKPFAKSDVSLTNSADLPTAPFVLELIE